MLQIVMSRHFWLFFLAGACVNALAFRLRAKRQMAEQPELAASYARLSRRLTIWISIPWLVMGIGCEMGGVPTILHFFRPRDGDPFVLAWFASVIVLWVLSLWWIFFRAGAEMLAEHRGLFGRNAAHFFSSPSGVKLTVVLGIACGVLAFVWMFLVDVPLADLAL